MRRRPGNCRWTVALWIEEGKAFNGLGIPAVILFGIPESKDEVGSGAYDPDGIVQRAVRAVKKGVPDLIVICDVCLDEYTNHGHCGLVKNGEIENDSTLELLAKTALTQTQAGADIVAPSDMMDGRVGRNRRGRWVGKGITESFSRVFRAASGFQTCRRWPAKPPSEIDFRAGLLPVQTGGIQSQPRSNQNYS